jgi:hypothetical protein
LFQKKLDVLKTLDKYCFFPCKIKCCNSIMKNSLCSFWQLAFVSVSFVISLIIFRSKIIWYMN